MDLFAKAADLGIQTEYFDGQGHRRTTGADALQIILDAMPARAPRRLLSQPVVVRRGRQPRSEVSDAARFPLHWKITLGPAVVAEGTAHERAIDWPGDLAVGTYRLHLADASGFTSRS